VEVDRFGGVGGQQQATERREDASSHGESFRGVGELGDGRGSAGQ
jgi:hypothetical protein